MEVINVVIKIIGLVIIALGVVMIYDARKLSQKWFSFGDRNDSTKVLKFVGFIITIIGGLITILN